MKNNILIIAFSLGFFAVNAQDFKETRKYIVTIETATKQQEYETTKTHILAPGPGMQKVATLEIPKSEAFHEMRISVLEKPQLNQIKEVIKVEFEYSGYSLSINTYYFLVTENGNYITLPKVTKIYDDITEPIVDYVFPTQKHGKEETIIKAIFHYTNNYSTEEIEVIQSIVWNDDDFGTQGAIAGLENQ
jgi:hypothetical protein